MKKKLAMLFAVLLWAEFAYAKDVLPRVRLVKPDVLTVSNNLEHVTVTATRLDHIDTQEYFGMRAALSNVVLYHKYDPVSDTWNYVGTDPEDLDYNTAK
jgi:hypothetical protein